MSQMLPVNEFKWVKDISEFNEDFIKSYNNEIDKVYFLESDVQYSENLHSFHNNLPFLSERRKIENIEKVVTTLYDKTEYVMHKRNLIKALNYVLVLKKIHKIIKFNQKHGQKYIDMNTEKNDFEKYFFKFINNAVFGKTLENVSKHRDIKLVTTETKTNYLVSEPRYHTTKFYRES